MTLHRSIIPGALLVVLLGAAMAPAFAGDYYDIVLANRLVGRLRDPGPYGSISARASQVEKNIVEALSVENVGTPKMWMKTEHGLPCVYIGGTFLLAARPGDVAGKGISKRALARQWLAGFKQQFPRAEPVTRIGSGGNGGGSGGSGVNPPPKKEVVVPEEDKALVGELCSLLADTRGLDDEAFATRSRDVATEAATLVWRCSADETTCDQLSEVEGADKAVRSTLNGLKFARDVSDDAFDQQKTLIAFTIVKRVRAALTPAG